MCAAFPHSDYSALSATSAGRWLFGERLPLILLPISLSIPAEASRVRTHRTQAKCLRWRVPLDPIRSHWVGSGRVTLRHVSPIPPLDPYVRLSPHTAHERGTFTGNFHFANSTEHSPWSACAFVGYLCTISLPSPSGPSPCARFSRVRTTMPHLTAWRASEVLDRVSPTYFHPPSHPLQALPCSQQRTQTRWFRWRVVECPVRALRLPSPMQGKSG